jgi:hypothetical protein
MVYLIYKHIDIRYLIYNHAYRYYIATYGVHNPILISTISTNRLLINSPVPTAYTQVYHAGCVGDEMDGIPMELTGFF